MNDFLLKTMALGYSLLLALPPGLCCSEFFSQHERLTPAQSACCHQSPPGPTDRAPDRPACQCCCDQDATIPAKTAPPAADAGIALAVATANLIALETAASGTQSDTLLEPGPPLHIVLCVWRC